MWSAAGGRVLKPGCNLNNVILAEARVSAATDIPPGESVRLVSGRLLNVSRDWCANYQPASEDDLLHVRSVGCEWENLLLLLLLHSLRDWRNAMRRE